jgi:hypothetical protein
MNRPDYYWPPEPQKQPVTPMPGIHIDDWLRREKGSVWPSVRLYAGIGACWVLVVAGTLAAVWLIGFVGAIGARCGWGY